MIDKVRNNADFQLNREEYCLDPFDNPNIAKFAIKISAPSSSAKYQVVSPYSTQNKFWSSQAIPVYSNEKFRLALIWKQYYQPKLSRCQFGISTQLRRFQNYRFRMKVLAGSSSSLHLQLHKAFRYNIDSSIFYEGQYANSQLYHKVGAALSWKKVSLGITHRVGFDEAAELKLEKRLSPSLSLQLRLNRNIRFLDNSTLQIGLAHSLTENLKSTIGAQFHQKQNLAEFKVEFSHYFEKLGEVMMSVNYCEGRSTVYFGFKSPSLHIVVPVFVSQGILGSIGAGIAYFLGFAVKKKTTKEIINYTDKSSQDRIEELKLISDKAADIYNKQKLSRDGLLIEEAYIGPKALLEDLMAYEQMGILLVTNNKFKDKVVDATVSLRFYTQKNQLKLPKGHKHNLLGIHYTQDSDWIYVSYIHKGDSSNLFCRIDDPIHIT